MVHPLTTSSFQSYLGCKTFSGLVTLRLPLPLWSFSAAVAKLDKYLGRFLTNPWALSAFALDPTFRQEGLVALLTVEYEAQSSFDQALDFIKARMKVYQENMTSGRTQHENEVQWVKKSKRVNRFASSLFQAGHQEITHDMNDPWECYNSNLKRFETTENESVLDYWKRMSALPEMRPLAMVASDILGLASSSASVERLFSQAGFVLGKKRGSLSARLLTKQVMLRM
ncbi:hypothetical protein QFC22_001834 [Naganishia vaughanmartiniae]|uniref:Uncharacterized protein n=1 Tax=Naganishia vaughanmartiniae TaxID=1424756 RepID=A0ACC2XHA6_9TREE|nr:hypothetical protein QFC22_001834 [Naganishia vaughanmartiniae]